MKDNSDQHLKVSLEVFKIPLRELDLPDIVMMEADTSFSTAVKLMKENKIGSLILGEGSTISGIFTERDAISKAPKIIADPNLSISSLMTQNPKTLTLDHTILDALALMSSKEFRHIPVIEAGGSQIKMISVKDILKYVQQIFNKRLSRFEAVSNWDKSQIHLQENAILYDLKKEQGTLSEEIFDVPLKRIYSTKVCTFDLDCSILDMILELHRKKTSIALIFEYETDLRGIITERDILYKIFALGRDLSQPVSQIMTQNPQVLTIHHQFGNAFMNMYTNNYRNVPIVNQEGQTLGNVSLLELIVFLAGELGVRNILKFS